MAWRALQGGGHPGFNEPSWEQELLFPSGSYLALNSLSRTGPSKNHPNCKQKKKNYNAGDEPRLSCKVSLWQSESNVNYKHTSQYLHIYMPKEYFKIISVICSSQNKNIKKVQSSWRGRKSVSGHNSGHLSWTTEVRWRDRANPFIKLLRLKQPETPPRVLTFDMQSAVDHFLPPW